MGLGSRSAMELDGAASEGLINDGLDAAFATLEQTSDLVKARCWPRDRFLPVETFLQRGDDWYVGGRLPVIFDVRSPTEFEQGHIPGAINMPLLDNVGRAEVGTLYATQGRDEAFDVALAQVYPKLDSMVEQAKLETLRRPLCGTGDEETDTQGKLHALIYCFRGGLRSQSVAELLTRHGFEIFTLEGGYKAFRQWSIDVLDRPQRICVLGGATGSGKTEVLLELREKGAQVLDLEALACHKGSVFGHLGENPQPSSEQMRNRISAEWRRFSPEHFVFIEDENSKIGTVDVPPWLYHRMRASQVVIHLDVPFDLRAERLVSVYGVYGAEALGEAVKRFEGYMGKEKVDALLAHLAAGELLPVCEVALRNYDKSYAHHIKKKRSEHQFVTLPVSTLDSKLVAGDVLEIAGKLEETVPIEPIGLTKMKKVHPKDRAAAKAARDAGPDSEGPGASSLTTREARCFCGAVVIRTRGDPASVSICHCSICRRLSGAPFVASALFPFTRVDIVNSDGSEVQLHETSTTRDVRRQRCAQCFSPVSAVLSKGSGFRAVPLAIFDLGPEDSRPASWRPQHHLHYDDRVIDVEDDLVKYRDRAKGPLFLK